MAWQQGFESVSGGEDRGRRKTLVHTSFMKSAESSPHLGGAEPFRDHLKTSRAHERPLQDGCQDKQPVQYWERASAVGCSQDSVEDRPCSHSVLSVTRAHCCEWMSARGSGHLSCRLQGDLNEETVHATDEQEDRSGRKGAEPKSTKRLRLGTDREKIRSVLLLSTAGEEEEGGEERKRSEKKMSSVSTEEPAFHSSHDGGEDALSCKPLGVLPAGCLYALLSFFDVGEVIEFRAISRSFRAFADAPCSLRQCTTLTITSELAASLRHQPPGIANLPTSGRVGARTCPLSPGSSFPSTFWWRLLERPPHLRKLVVCREALREPSGGARRLRGSSSAWAYLWKLIRHNATHLEELKITSPDLQCHEVVDWGVWRAQTLGNRNSGVEDLAPEKDEPHPITMNEFGDMGRRVQSEGRVAQGRGEKEKTPAEMEAEDIVKPKKGGQERGRRDRLYTHRARAGLRDEGREDEGPPEHRTANEEDAGTAVCGSGHTSDAGSTVVAEGSRGSVAHRSLRSPSDRFSFSSGSSSSAFLPSPFSSFPSLTSSCVPSSPASRFFLASLATPEKGRTSRDCAKRPPGGSQDGSAIWPPHSELSSVNLERSSSGHTGVCSSIQSTSPLPLSGLTDQQAIAAFPGASACAADPPFSLPHTASCSTSPRLYRSHEEGGSAACLVAFPRLKKLSLFGCHAFCWLRCLSSCRFPACQNFSVVNQCPRVHVGFAGLSNNCPECSEDSPLCLCETTPDGVALSCAQAEQDLLQVLAAMPILQALRLETKLFVGRRIWRAVLGGAYGEPRGRQKPGCCSPHLVSLAIGDRAVLHLADVVHELQNTPPPEGFVASRVISPGENESHEQEECYQGAALHTSSHRVPVAEWTARETGRPTYTASHLCEDLSHMSLRNRTTVGGRYCACLSRGPRRRPELLKLSVAGWGTGREKVPSVVLNSLEIVVKAYPRCQIVLDSFTGTCAYPGRGPSDDSSGEENGPLKQVLPRLLQQLKHLCIKYDDPDKDLFLFSSPVWSSLEQTITGSPAQLQSEVQLQPDRGGDAGARGAPGVGATEVQQVAPATKSLLIHPQDACLSVCSCSMKGVRHGPMPAPGCRDLASFSPSSESVRSGTPGERGSDASCLSPVSLESARSCYLPCVPPQRTFSVPARRVSVDFLHFSPLKHNSLFCFRFGIFSPLGTMCNGDQGGSYPSFRVLGLPESPCWDSLPHLPTTELRKPVRAARRVCSVERRRGPRRSKKKCCVTKPPVPTYTGLCPWGEGGIIQGSARSAALVTPRRRTFRCSPGSSTSQGQLASPRFMGNDIGLSREQGQLRVTCLSRNDSRQCGEQTFQSGCLPVSGSVHFRDVASTGRERRKAEEGGRGQDLRRAKMDLVRRYVLPVLRSDVFQGFLLAVQRPPRVLEFFSAKDRGASVSRGRHHGRQNGEQQENAGDTGGCELAGSHEAFLPVDAKMRRKNAAGQVKRLGSVGQVTKTAVGVKAPLLTRFAGGAQVTGMQRRLIKELSREKNAPAGTGRVANLTAGRAAEVPVRKLGDRLFPEQKVQARTSRSGRAPEEQPETGFPHVLLSPKAGNETEEPKIFLSAVKEATVKPAVSAGACTRTANEGRRPRATSKGAGSGTASREPRSFLARRRRTRQRVDVELLRAILSEEVLKRKLKGLELQLEDVADSTYTASVLGALANLKNKKIPELGEKRTEPCTSERRVAAPEGIVQEGEAAARMAPAQTAREKEEPAYLRGNSEQKQRAVAEKEEEGDKAQVKGREDASREGWMEIGAAAGLKGRSGVEGLGQKRQGQNTQSLSDRQINGKGRSEHSSNAHSEAGADGQGAEEREGKNHVHSGPFGLGDVEAPRLEVLRLVNLRLCRQDLFGSTTPEQVCLVSPPHAELQQGCSSLEGMRDGMPSVGGKRKRAQQESCSCPLLPEHGQWEGATARSSSDITTGEKAVAILADFLKAYPEVQHIEAEVPPFLFDPDEHPSHLEECQQLQAVEALMQVLGFEKERVEVSGASAYAQVVLYRRKREPELGEFFAVL